MKQNQTHQEKLEAGQAKTLKIIVNQHFDKLSDQLQKLISEQLEAHRKAGFTTNAAIIIESARFEIEKFEKRQRKIAEANARAALSVTEEAQEGRRLDPADIQAIAAEVARRLRDGP